MRFLWACLLIIASYTTVANEETIDTWTCTESSYTTEVLVTAVSYMPSGYGDIDVAGINHKGFYRVDGFDRRWNFGLNEDGSFDYSFFIDPKGFGRYSNFSSVEAGETVMPSQFFHCNKASE